MKLGLTTALALGALSALASAPAAGQSWQSACHSDQNKPACLAFTRREMLQIFGLADADALPADAVDQRRIFIVDDYGRALIAVTFRRNGQGAEVVVHGAPLEEGGARQPLIASLAPEEWAKFVRLDEPFGRPTPPPYV
jgi:hypothetical protein